MSRKTLWLSFVSAVVLGLPCTTAAITVQEISNPQIEANNFNETVDNNQPISNNDRWKAISIIGTLVGGLGLLIFIIYPREKSVKSQERSHTDSLSSNANSSIYNVISGADSSSTNSSSSCDYGGSSSSSSSYDYGGSSSSGSSFDYGSNTNSSSSCDYGSSTSSSYSSGSGGSY